MAGSHGGGSLYTPAHPVRFVTAAALFGGHDAAINIMRRILQAQGAEVVHLGHDRSVREVVDAVLEEDAQGVAGGSAPTSRTSCAWRCWPSTRRTGAAAGRCSATGSG